MTDKTDPRALVERLTGFTPGPWAYRPEKYDDWGMVRGADKYPVASASTCRSDDFEKNEHRRKKTDPADANARLIAAAPDLHAALRAALDRAEKAEAERDEQVDWVKSLSDDVIAAEAKASKARAEGYAQAVDDILKEVEDYLPEFGAGVAQDGTDLIIDQTWRSFRKITLAHLHTDAPALGSAAPPWDWAVRQWYAEVANRPLQNIHRRTLDTTWRQVIRHYGGDDVTLIGPSHDDLLKALAGDHPSPRDDFDPYGDGNGPCP